MIKLKSLLPEGGHAFDDVVGIKQTEVKATVNSINNSILKKLKLKGIGFDCFLLGTAGKKPDDQLSGDIDIGVSSDEIASINTLKLSEVYQWMINKLNSMGYETKEVPGFSQVSVSYPIIGRKNKDKVQVDFMLSSNLDWTKFIYYSPNLKNGESKYKSIYRNLLLAGSVSLFNVKILKKDKSNVPIEIQKYALRLNDGIYSIVKSFAGSNETIVKTGKVLKDRDKFFSRTPDEIVKFFIGKSYTENDINTFEKLYDIIFKKESNVKPLRSEIKKYLINGIKLADLPMPEMINKS